MDYQSVEARQITYPESSFDRFVATAMSCVESFTTNNQVIGLIDRKALQLAHFHSLLNTLFHQVYMSSTSFALAGSMCDSRYFKIREYLFEHAEEEQDHWKWIIQNLYDTGYSGSDPRSAFPSFPTQAYISFAMHLAHKQPIARLSMAYVLEGLSGQLGVDYGQKAAQQLQLNREQMSFFLLHGELDKGHSHDILDVLERASLTPYEWAYCEYAAECTLSLYRNLYNHSVVSVTNEILI
ncbi:MAG TPA: iron-containing redox enzyme family protein [Mucilaginibacter sp.]|jgi:hypothetical protein|nr:iron-containing redox enzyme family protein [Mucilaginibacter sp.]